MTSPTTPADYATAFYDLAKMMGLSARDQSPKEVWEMEMRPRLAAMLPTPADIGKLVERLRDWPACGGNDALSASYVGALLSEAAAALSASTAGRGVEIESAAWAWLEKRFGTENDDPVDRAYAADEMVDAFHAGCAHSPTAQPAEIGKGEREGLTSDFLAMSPLQKWDTLTLNGLLGTDEPWIDEMRDSLLAAQARVRVLEEALGNADYLVDRLTALHAGKPVRDLGEAQALYHSARAALGEVGRG